MDFYTSMEPTSPICLSLEVQIDDIDTHLVEHLCYTSHQSWDIVKQEKKRDHSPLLTGLPVGWQKSPTIDSFKTMTISTMNHTFTSCTQYSHYIMGESRSTALGYLMRYLTFSTDDDMYWVLRIEFFYRFFQRRFSREKSTRFSDSLANMVVEFFCFF